MLICFATYNVVGTCLSTSDLVFDISVGFHVLGLSSESL